MSSPEQLRNIEADQGMMDRYGIIRVPADYFLYGQYRYTNLKDAIAQARRDTVEADRF